MSVEFDTPANRIIQQLQPKSQFGLDTSLPDLTWLRQLSVQGRLTYDFMSATADDNITITPPTGETQFIYQIIINVADTGVWQFTLTNSGITRTVFTIREGTATRSTQFVYNIFDSLSGDGVKTINLFADEITGTANVHMTILGWKENTARIRDSSI